ncbi:MFS transporter [Saccharopolyspora sp. SCSIO 74807]|uniref:MFS transporter n=1 Tax=Saccharopolyspora sp. SCSIO 74807 TaxID=3118084 RepID=UPI0030D402A5
MTQSVAEAGTRWRAHALVLAFGTFAVGTDAYVIAGVLPELAHSLDIGVAAAGQLVTVFAIGYAVLSPVLAALTSHWSRRTVLLTALVLFALGNVATALAPGYGAVLAARLLAAAGAAMYTPNAAATAAALAGAAKRGQAFSIVNVGLSSSLVLGAPLGTAIGALWGWRATMWFLTALAVLISPIIAWRLPSVQLPAAAGLRQRFAPLGDRRVLGALAITVIAFVGIFIPYTYISVVYAPVIEGRQNLLTVLLLVFGVAGTVGNLTAGHVADRQGPRRVVVAVAVLLAVVFGIAVVARESLWAAIPVIVVSGLLSWSVLSPQQHRVVALRPEASALVVSLNAAAVYLGVSLSGVLGAAGLNLLGQAALPLLGSAFLIVAALLTLATGRPREPETAQPSPSASATGS